MQVEFSWPFTQYSSKGPYVEAEKAIPQSPNLFI
jgi:hypothetical protein